MKILQFIHKLRFVGSWLCHSCPGREELGKYPVNSVIFPPFYADNPKGIFLEEYVKIKEGATIINSPSEKVIVKKYSVIAANFCAVPNSHVKTVGIPQFLLGSSHINDKSSDLTIGEDVWIGSGVTVLCGANIGRGCVIGANSLVTKPMPPYSVAVGSPARIIKAVFTVDEILKHEAAIYPESERMTREELEALFEKYYKGMNTFGYNSVLTKEEQERLIKLKKSWGYKNPE